jgi:hypothetical protein
MVEPQRPYCRVHHGEGTAEATRLDGDKDRGGKDARDCDADGTILPTVASQQPAGHCQPEGRNQRGDGGIDGDGVAGGTPPVVGTYADEERGRDAAGAPPSVAHERASGIRGSRARKNEPQRHRHPGQHDVGQPFEADRHGEAREDPGGGCRPRLAVAPGHRPHQDHGECDLDVMVIDAPRDEMLERRQSDGGEHQRDRRRVAPGNPKGDRGRASHGRHQPEHRPHRAHQPLGKRGFGNAFEQPQHSRQPGVDQSRPMGVVPVGRAEARLMQVEPAVTVDEAAHLDKPHGVVHVGQRERRGSPVVGEELQDDDQPGQAEEQGKVRHGRALGQGSPASGEKTGLFHSGRNLRFP